MNYLSLLVVLDKEFTFHLTVSDSCHDLLMMSIVIHRIIAISNICGVDYRCINVRITKSEGKDLLVNTDLTVKSESLQKKLSCLKHE